MVNKDNDSFYRNKDNDLKQVCGSNGSVDVVLIKSSTKMTMIKAYPCQAIYCGSFEIQGKMIRW